MATALVSPTRFTHRYSVVAFFVLAMLLGAGSVVLVAQGVIPADAALLSSLSASIAGVIMTAVEDGRAGLKLMLKRLLIWRVGLGYWLFAIFFIFLAVPLSSLTNPLFGGDPLSLEELKPTFDIFFLFISFFIVAGLGQELGWTGFLLPRLQARYSALTSCFIRAIIVGVWHLPLLYYASLQLPAFASFPYGGWIAQKGFLAAFGTLTLVFALPWSIFSSWIFNNTRGSLLLVAVLHTSEIWVVYWMLQAGISESNLDNYWGYAAVMVVTSALIVLISGAQNLSRQRERIVHQSSPG